MPNKLLIASVILSLNVNDNIDKNSADIVPINHFFALYSEILKVQKKKLVASGGKGQNDHFYSFFNLVSIKIYVFSINGVFIQNIFLVTLKDTLISF